MQYSVFTFLKDMFACSFFRSFAPSFFRLFACNYVFYAETVDPISLDFNGKSL